MEHGMQVHGVQGGDVGAAHRAPQANRAELQGAVGNEGVEVVDGGDADGGQRGVIQNLINGHYNGVAAARLQLNFAAEIAALNATASSLASAEAQTDSETEFRATVEATVEGLLDSGDLSPDQGTAVQGAYDAFLGALSGEPSVDADSIVVDDGSGDSTAAAPAPTVTVSEAYQTLVSQLHEILDPTAPSEPSVAIESAPIVDTEPTPGTEPDPAIEPATSTESTSGTEPVSTEPVGTEPVGTESEGSDPIVLESPNTGVSNDPVVTEPESVDFSTFFAALDEAYTDYQTAQDTTITSAIVPEPSAPNGNGVAYAKFMVMLQGEDPGGALDVAA